MTSVLGSIAHTFHPMHCVSFLMMPWEQMSWTAGKTAKLMLGSRNMNTDLKEAQELSYDRLYLLVSNSVLK